MVKIALPRCAAVALVVGACSGATPPRVTTPDGSLVGFNARGVDAFLGIRFAAAPTGARRFAPPQPVAPWTGDVYAQRWGAGCLQSGSKAVGGRAAWPSINVSDTSEDCLFLNVWAPENASDLPVMVYLPSGEFRYGGANDRESNWPSFGSGAAVEPVVYVAANSRLNFLGYAALKALAPRNAASGNAGLQDQRAALAWVKRSIRAFGGDPARVTIFGESSGGAAVGFHLVSPRSANLFARAILESPGLTQSKTWARAEADATYAVSAVAGAGSSGCGFSEAAEPWSRYVGFAAEGPEKATLNFSSSPGTAGLESVVAAARAACAARSDCFAASVRYDNGSGTWATALLGGASGPDVVLTNLTSKYRPSAADSVVEVRPPDPSKILSCAVNAPAADLIRASNGVPYGDSFKNDAVSPVVDGVELTGLLADLVATEPLNADAVLGGSNLDEGTEFMSVAEPIACDAGEEGFSTWAAAMWGSAVAADLAPAYADLVEPVPLCRSSSDPSGKSTTWAWKAAMRAAGDGAILCRTRDLLARAKNASFWYQFRVVPTYSVNDGDDMRFLGSFHGAEVPYVFGDAFELASAGERAVAAAVGCYWTSFAAYGDPAAAACAAALPEWPRMMAAGNGTTATLVVATDAAKTRLDATVAADLKRRACGAFAP